jgi:hypothetical protein
MLTMIIRDQIMCLTSGMLQQWRGSGGGGQQSAARALEEVEGRLTCGPHGGLNELRIIQNQIKLIQTWFIQKGPS